MRLTALLWSQTTTLEDAADAEPVNWGVEQALASHHHHKHVVQTMEKAAAVAVPAAVAQTAAAPAELTEPPKSCKEEGWCSNLAPLDDGTPHPNCVSWAKSTTSDCHSQLQLAPSSFQLATSHSARKLLIFSGSTVCF